MVVTVVGIDRGKIRLGIDAPRDVAVYRSELLPVVRPASPPAIDGGSNHDVPRGA